MTAKSYCVLCGEYVSPDIEDESFSHEFGTEVVFRCTCPECENDLDLPAPDLGEYDDNE